MSSVLRGGDKVIGFKELGVRGINYKWDKGISFKGLRSWHVKVMGAKRIMNLGIRGCMG